MFSGRFSLRAICAGLLADILSSQILGLVLLVVLAMKAFGSASSTQTTQVLNDLQLSPSFLLPATALGLLGSTIGGYVAAFLSERDDAWRNGLVTGSLSLLTSMLFLLGTDDVSPWISGVGLALSLPATLLGAFCCLSGRDDENAVTGNSQTDGRDEL